MSSGWGSPTAADLNIGGRSPKAADCREKDRASRRLGLTHSLTSPRTPEPAAKPELPSRPPAENTDDLPRPRSLSPPRRTPAPPSVTGSSLSAKLERASFVRASNAPPVPPPPQTRARFSAKRGELDEVVAGDDSGGGGAGVPAAAAAAAAPTPAGRVEEPLTPTPKSGGRGGGGRSPGSGSRVAALAMAIESQRQQQREQPPQDDDTPVMTLPAVITAAQAAGLAAEKRMRDSRNHHHQYPQQQQQQLPSTSSPAARQAVREEPRASSVAVGMGAKRVGRVRGRGAVAAARPEDLVGPHSAAGSSDFGSVAAAASVYGTGKSQIQASPQYWVPRKLSRSPVNKSSIASKSASYSPTRSTRPLW